MEDYKMIKFEQDSSGFKLYFKDHLFLEHDNKAPCFKIGKSKARYKMRYGEFIIKEKNHYA